MLWAAFIEGSQLPAPYWLMIGPFDLMEAADWKRIHKIRSGCLQAGFCPWPTIIPKWPSPFGLMKIRFCNVLHLGDHKNSNLWHPWPWERTNINISWILCKLTKKFAFGRFGDTFWLAGRVLRYERVLFSISITGLTRSQWGAWVGGHKMCFKHFNISDQSGNWTLPGHCWVNAHPSEPPWKIDSERFSIQTQHESTLLPYLIKFYPQMFPEINNWLIFTS